MSRDSGVNCIGLGENSKTGNPRGKQQRMPTGSMNILNNQTREQCQRNYENNVVSHQAMVHVPDHLVNQQDSGFSSPRTDPDNNSSLYQQINNLSMDQCNNDSNSVKSATEQTDSGRKDQVLTRETNNNSSKPEMDRYAGRKSGHDHAEKVGGKRSAVSMETLTITGSEVYPPYMPPPSFAVEKEGGSLTPSSSWSGSSKQTVMERFPHLNGHALSTSNPGSLVRNEPYMELQVAHDCPYHGDAAQGHMKGYERSPRRSRYRQPSQGAGGQCPVHTHPGDRQTTRNDSVRRSLTDKMVANMTDSHQRANQKGHDPRLAFLGDVEVVGIV